MSKQPSHEYDDAILDLLDGELSEQEQADLHAWLNESPEHYDRFAHLSFIHSQIASQLHSQRSSDGVRLDALQAEPSQDESELPPIHLASSDRLTKQQILSALSYVLRHTFTPKRLVTGGVAAALLLGAVLAIVLMTGPEPQPQIAEIPGQPEVPVATSTVVATLTASHNARWAQGALAPGSQLQANQRLTLTAGFAEITTNRGAIALLEAPATIKLTNSDNAIRLESGKLVGICETESSKGFLVRTPHVDITDLGTRFGIDVVRGLATEVHVSQGEVVVAQSPSNGTTQPVRQHLTANQAVRCDAFTHALASITPAFEKFGPALGTYSLRSTGLGLAEGAVDPHWQVVADANGPLKAPLPLVVQYSYSKKHPHYPAPNNDPDIAQWLFFATTGPSNYYPFPPTEGLNAARLTLESRFDLPDLAQFRGQVLHLRFATPEPALSLQINGQTITPQPKEGKKDRKIVYHELNIPINQAALKPGENLIRVELTDHTNRDIASFYLDWEIRPASEPTRSTGSQAP